jgi:hypothetical protein
MRFLLINHHPDCLYYQHQALQHLGHEVVVADEALNRLLTPDNSSSTQGDYFDVAGRLFPISRWNFSPKFVSTLENDDIIVTIHGEVAAKQDLHAHKIIMDIQNHHWLHRVNYGDNVTLITNHPTFGKDRGVKYVPNYVQPRPIRQNPKYVTTINSSFPRITQTVFQEFGELMIAAGNHPGNVIDDEKALNDTCMYVHESVGGIHYYSVNKALNMGIPVYMDRNTYEDGGFTDLPEDLFIFSEQYTPRDAYNKALTLDPVDIQKGYQQNLNLENTSKSLGALLENIL